MMEREQVANFDGSDTRIRVNSEFLGLLLVVLLIGALVATVEEGLDVDVLLAIAGTVVGLVFQRRTRTARQVGALARPLNGLLWGFLGTWAASIVASIVIWEALTGDTALAIVLVLTSAYLMLQLRADLGPASAAVPQVQTTTETPPRSRSDADPAMQRPARAPGCPSCGGPIVPGWSFCGVCGAGLTPVP